MRIEIGVDARRTRKVVPVVEYPPGWNGGIGLEPIDY
jgi:hypothetical protein